MFNTLSSEEVVARTNRLLVRLDLLRRRLYLGEPCSQTEIDDLALDFEKLRTEPRFSAYIKASILELAGRAMERTGANEEATNKYKKAAETLIQSTEITATELIAKSLLLRVTGSLQEAAAAYKRLKRHIEGQLSTAELRIRALFEPMFYGHRVPGGQSVQGPLKNRISVLERIILRLVTMGKTEPAFRLIKYSNIERVDVFCRILEIASELDQTGKDDRAKKVLKAAYAHVPSVYHPAERCRILLRIALECEDMHSLVAKKMQTEVFENLRSGSYRAYTIATYPEISAHHKFFELQKIVKETIERGDFDKAQSLTGMFAGPTPYAEDSPHGFLKGVALAFAKKGAVRKAFQTARLIKSSAHGLDHRHYALDDMVPVLFEAEKVTAEEVLREANASYRDKTCPNILHIIAAKFASEGRLNRALEVASSIEQPFAKVCAYLAIAQIMKAIADAAPIGISATLGQSPEKARAKKPKQTLKARALEVVQMAFEAAQGTEDFIRSELLGRIAVVLSWIGEKEESAVRMDNAIEIARHVGAPSLISLSLRDRVTQLLAMDQVNEAIQLAGSIEEPDERSKALLKIIPHLADRTEIRKEAIEQAKKSIGAALRLGISLDSLFILVEGIREIEPQIDLSDYAREAEETGLFLKGLSRHPTKVAIELGWVFKNLWFASSLYKRSGSSEKINWLEQRLRRIGVFSPLAERPLKAEEIDLFVERNELHQLDACIAIRDRGFIGICGNRGSGKTTLVNAYLSKYLDDPKSTIIRVRCPPHCDHHQFMNLLLYEIVEEFVRKPSISVRQRYQLFRLKRDLKYRISFDNGLEAGAGIGGFRAVISRTKHLIPRDLTHAPLMARINKMLQRQSGYSTRSLIVIDDFDNVAMSEGIDPRTTQLDILRELRGAFSIPGVFFLLMGLETQFLYAEERAKATKDITFDDIINLKLDTLAARHFLSEVLESRLRWLNLTDVFDQSGKSELIEMANGSPRGLIGLLSKYIRCWLDNGIYRFDREAVRELARRLEE